MRLTLSKKGMLVIAVPFLVQLAFLLGYSGLVQEADQLADKERHNKEVFGRTNWLSTLFPLSTACALAYASTGNDFYLPCYKFCVEAIPAEFKEIALVLANCYAIPVAEVRSTSRKELIPDFVQGNWSAVYSRSDDRLLGYMAPDESYVDFFSGKSKHLSGSKEAEIEALKATDDLSSAYKSGTEWLLVLAEISAKRTATEAANLVREKQAGVERVWQTFFEQRRAILKDERFGTRVGTDASRANREQLRHWITAGIVFDIAMGLGVIYLFSKGITRRLAVLEENSRRLARDDELKPPLKGSDELSMLDATFHEMANSLTQAKRALEDSERRIRTIIESMPIGVSVTDLEGRIEFVNTRMQSMVGVREEQVVGKHFNVVIQNLEKDFALVAEAKEQIPEQKPSEVEIDGPSGALTVEVVFKQFAMAEASKVLVIANDITQRKELEKRKHEFIAMVTHDLKTPLTSIQMFLELLERNILGALPDKARKHLVKVQRNVDRLVNLVADILDFERMEAGKQELNLEPTSVESIIERSIEAVEEFANQHRVLIQHDECDANINADGERLIRVLINLLSNAVKFSPEEAVVQVSVECTDRWVTIRVIDNGRGIPSTHLDTVFEKYKQVEAKDATEKKGTGLGLPICKDIIERHGGTIGVNSQLGKGSTFWFRVPVDCQPKVSEADGSTSTS